MKETITIIGTAKTFSLISKNRHTDKLIKELEDSTNWDFILRLADGINTIEYMEADELDLIIIKIYNQTATADDLNEFASIVFNDAVITFTLQS